MNIFSYISGFFWEASSSAQEAQEASSSIQEGSSSTQEALSGGNPFKYILHDDLLTSIKSGVKLKKIVDTDKSVYKPLSCQIKLVKAGLRPVKKQSPQYIGHRHPVLNELLNTTLKYQ